MEENHSPILSILVCTHNRLNLLKRAIGSVANQTFKDYHLIILNDASVDGTYEYLTEYAILNPSVQIIHNKNNLGIQKSLKIAMRQVTTKYLARLDDDDYWIEKDKIQIQITALENNPKLGIIGTAYASENEVMVFPQTDEDIRKQMLYRCPFRHSSIIFRKTVHDQVGGYNSELKYLEDWELWVRMGKVSELQNLKMVSTFVKEEDNLSQEFFIKQQTLIGKYILTHAEDYPNTHKAKAYHAIVRYFFKVFPIEGWFHKLAQKIFRVVFGKGD